MWPTIHKLFLGAEGPGRYHAFSAGGLASGACAVLIAAACTPDSFRVAGSQEDTETIWGTKARITKEQAEQLAVELVLKELCDLNAEPRSEERGGPFLFSDYRSGASRRVVRRRPVLDVFFEYSKPVGFLGHPAHFSVWVYCDTGETSFFPGM